MKNTIKLLSIALAMTMAMRSFAMSRTLVNKSTHLGTSLVAHIAACATQAKAEGAETLFKDLL